MEFNKKHIEFHLVWLSLEICTSESTPYFPQEVERFNAYSSEGGKSTILPKHKLETSLTEHHSIVQVPNKNLFMHPIIWFFFYNECLNKD